MSKLQEDFAPHDRPHFLLLRMLIGLAELPTEALCAMHTDLVEKVFTHIHNVALANTNTYYTRIVA